MGLASFFFAPQIVAILLGPGYDAAVPALRILSLLVPATAVSQVLGIQWMLPLGLDRSFTRIILAAGLVNIMVALLLAPTYYHVGMAYALLAAETIIPVSIYIVLLRQKLNPFTKVFRSVDNLAPDDSA